MPKLILIAEENPRQVFQLERAMLMIGRDEESQIQVHDHSVSRNHASIVFDGKEFMVRDNGSTNGTYVNGERVSRHALKQHDLIRFGEALFLVDMEPPRKGPKGTDVLEVTHVGSKKGKIVEVASKSRIPGSPVRPVRVILSSGTPKRRSGGDAPPLTVR